MKTQARFDPIKRLEKIIMDDNQKYTPIKKYKRGSKGRFVSAKSNSEIKTINVKQLITTFYGKSIRKYQIDNKQYFVVSDILSLAKPINLSTDSIKYTDNFLKIKNMNIKIVDQLEVADAQEILTIIKEVIGVFPGPLARWLTT